MPVPDMGSFAHKEPLKESGLWYWEGGDFAAAVPAFDGLASYGLGALWARTKRAAAEFAFFELGLVGTDNECCNEADDRRQHRGE